MFVKILQKFAINWLLNERLIAYPVDKIAKIKAV